MSDLIGYFDTRCGVCGERYNGYRSHSCPLSMEEANAQVIAAAVLWLRQFAERPRVKVDAALFDAVSEYERSDRAEPDRKVLAAREAKVADAFVKSLTKRRKKGRGGNAR